MSECVCADIVPYLFYFFIQLKLQSRQIGIHQRLKILIIDCFDMRVFLNNNCLIKHDCKSTGFYSL